MHQKNGDDKKKYSGAIATQIQDTEDFMLALKSTKNIEHRVSWNSEDVTLKFKVRMTFPWKSLSKGERGWDYLLESMDDPKST